MYNENGIWDIVDENGESNNYNSQLKTDKSIAIIVIDIILVDRI